MAKKTGRARPMNGKLGFQKGSKSKGGCRK